MTVDLPQDLPDVSPQPRPDTAPPIPAAVRDIAEHGLEPRDEPPKRVLVIGAGLAGLVAAYELKRQGHEVVVLEAQNRVGGRVYTLRTLAPGLYAEAGAMRIPRAAWIQGALESGIRAARQIHEAPARN